MMDKKITFKELMQQWFKTNLKRHYNIWEDGSINCPCILGFNMGYVQKNSALLWGKDMNRDNAVTLKAADPNFFKKFKEALKIAHAAALKKDRSGAMQ
jgi:hypothetical protein